MEMKMLKNKKINTTSNKTEMNIIFRKESCGFSCGTNYENTKMQGSDKIEECNKKNNEKTQKILASIIAVLPLLLSGVYFILGVFYKYKCKEFYGVILDCYNMYEWDYRFFSISVVMFLGFLGVWLFRKIIKMSNDKYEKIAICFVQTIFLFLFNLIMVVKIIELSVFAKFMEFIYYRINEIVFTVIILVFSGIISLGVSMFLNSYSQKGKKNNNFIVAFMVITIVLQILFAVFSFCVSAFVQPNNITEYTVVKTNEDTQYLVIGDYNDNFVCKEFKVISVNKIDETKSEFENLQDIEISFDKNQFELISYDEIYKIGTVKFSKVSSS
jgi:hypothetical protein